MPYTVVPSYFPIQSLDHFHQEQTKIFINLNKYKLRKPYPIKHATKNSLILLGGLVGLQAIYIIALICFSHSSLFKSLLWVHILMVMGWFYVPTLIEKKFPIAVQDTKNDDALNGDYTEILAHQDFTQSYREWVVRNNNICNSDFQIFMNALHYYENLIDALDQYVQFNPNAPDIYLAKQTILNHRLNRKKSISPHFSKEALLGPIKSHKDKELLQQNTPMCSAPSTLKRL